MSGSERSRKPNVDGRIVADPDQVDVGAAIDLSAAEEKDVDASLPGGIEYFAAAIGKRIAGPSMDQGDTKVAVGQGTHHQRRRPRYRRRGTDRHVVDTGQHPRDHANE